MNPDVNFFFEKPSKWQDAYKTLRSITLKCGLRETLKWGVPCYTLEDKNVLLIHGFKNYCAVLFHKGALLKDPQGILVQQTKNTQAARQLRFTSTQEITRMQPIIKAYIHEAIEVEKAGLSVAFTQKHELEFCEEFIRKLDEVPDLHDAFEALTPGRQRAYHLYFSSAKQSKTRHARIEKCIPGILAGKGLHD